MVNWLLAHLRDGRARIRVICEFVAGLAGAIRATPQGDFRLLTLRECIRDSCNYTRYSGTARGVQSREAFGAKLTIEYHCIEKALALQEPRTGFGKERVEQLIASIKEFVGKYGADETVQVSINVLQSYYEFNANRGVRDDSLREEIEGLRLISQGSGTWCRDGGVTVLRRCEVEDFCRVDFDKFTKSRYSIRDFSAEPVAPDLIESAARMALKTPSVCNRQPWKVHAYFDRERKQRILACQSGNRGFGDVASVILVVTAPASAFFGVGERNEPYIDGGMFSMSLVYALHSLGLASCCLNLCATDQHAAELRRAAEIADDEILIMMIAVGNMPEHFAAAQSHRKPLDEVLEMHGIPRDAKRGVNRT